MAFSFGQLQNTIRLTVVSVFIIATVLTAGVATGLQYYFGQEFAKKAAAAQYTAAASAIAAELRSTRKVNTIYIDLLAENPAFLDPTMRPTHLEIFTDVLKKNPLWYGIYLGHADGSFFEVINLDVSKQARRKLSALHSDRWLIVSVQQGANGRERHYRYLDHNLQERASRSEPSRFDVRERPWYRNALASDSVYFSEPYLFAQLGEPGATQSRRIVGSDTVIGIDTKLSTYSAFLARQAVSGAGDIYLYKGDGEIIASTVEAQTVASRIPVPAFTLTPQEKLLVDSLPVLKVSNEQNWPPVDYTQAGQAKGYSIDIIKLIAQMTGIQVKFVNGYTWSELVEKFKTDQIDILHPVSLTEDNQNWGLAGESLAALPHALVTRDGNAPLTGIEQLNGRSLAIPKGWSIIPVIRQHFPEVNIVVADTTLHAMELVIAGEADAALDREIVMRYLARHYFLKGITFHSNVGIGPGAAHDQIHLMVAKNQPQLRALIDRAIAAIGKQQRHYLSETWMNFQGQSAATESSTVPAPVLVEIAANPDRHEKISLTRLGSKDYVVYVAATAPKDKQTLYVGILSPLDSVLGPFLEKMKLSILITALLLLLLLPLSWLFANPIVRPIKQLATENDKVRRRQYADVTRVSSNVKELDELSESMVNMVAAIQAHELAQRKLMDSFIQLIAQAIDDKSAYTGGHCLRVPELALMLAERASRSDSPPFSNFRLDSDDQWREYRIAAWLHDCGKITTPEHIVDKGSKLETIYNRIHEVRMRFEVLWRDAQISYWEALAASPKDRESLEHQLENAQQKLKEDFDFVAECNVGGEFLDQEKLDRLQDIAKVSWQRQFDNRLGLSPVEELRVPRDQPELPVTEQLLSDKPEHIIERTRSTDYPPELGINMDIPEHLYNQGELYNLSISRGTLTAEDRFKINEHMISTIKMLESLPFPDELKNVPRYASTHHETMKGSGYPRKLPGDQLSIPERILAVADVFEALTASDRPYKKAKPISVAVDILHKMVLDNHIDRDCFELFVRDKVYQQYAEKYLAPEQVDKVDASKYLQESA